MSIFVKDITIFNKDIDYVRELIPSDSRMNFEKNLCYLKIDIKYEENYDMAAYFPKINQIVLYRKPIEEIKRKYKEHFSNFFRYTMRHELLHVASCRFDKKNNVIHSGFSTIYLNKDEEDKNILFRYLEEGFLDLLLRKDYPNGTYKYSLYTPLVDVLSEIVGMDLMKETFFNSRGIQPIINKLKEYGIEEDKISDFFISFNNLENDIYQEKISSTLPNIQNMLSDFYLKKAKTIESKEELIESKPNFINKLNKSISVGQALLDDLYMNSDFYRFRTESIKKKVKSI